jgi:uncharacterized protein
MDWLYPLSGFVVGLIVGTTGVGGGSLMTPLLILLFGVSPATAVGTDLLYAGLTKLGGSIAHARHGTVNWKIAGWLALGSVPAAGLTSLALSQLGTQSNAFQHVVTTTLGVALILTAAAILFRPYLLTLSRRWSRRQDLERPQRKIAATVATGVVLGILVTISSVGAGALGTLALFLLYPGLHARQIVGTDIAHAVPLTLVAGSAHAVMGSVDFSLLGSLLLGSLPGIWIGSQVGARLPEHYLRAALATMLLVIGGKFVL